MRIDIEALSTCINYALKRFHLLDDSSDFKEPLEIIDLSKRHGDEQEGLKHGPPHHTGVGIVIDCKTQAMSVVEMHYRVSILLGTLISKLRGCSMHTLIPRVDNNCIYNSSGKETKLSIH